MSRPVTATKETAEITANNYYNECVENDTIPYKEQLAIKLDITDDTLKAWSDELPGLFGTIKKIEQLQLYQLQKRGLEGKVTPSVSIFLMKANHGLIETEKHIQNVNLNTIDEAQLDAAIRQKASEVGAL